MMWLLIFFLTPIAEMYLLITVAGYIDAWPTIILVMLTAVIGVALLKRQGLATLTRGMGRLNHGEVPAREMAEGILLAVAGALLLTPGFITDCVGFVLLFPPARMAIASVLLKRVEAQGMSGGFHTRTHFEGSFEQHTFDQQPFDQQKRRDGPGGPFPEDDRRIDGATIVEGDFERKS